MNVRFGTRIINIQAIMKSLAYKQQRIGHYIYSTAPNICKRRNIVRLVSGIGLFGATAYGWNVKKRLNTTVFADNFVKPNIHPVRSIRRETDRSGLKLTLFQYQTCPFCCKVRAYLDFYGFSYDVVEVNSVWRTQIKWSKYQKVPILLCEDRNTTLQVNDSSVIISLLQSFLTDSSTPLEKYITFYPELESIKNGKVVYDFPNKYFIMYQDQKVVDKGVEERRKEERTYRQWADDSLVHTLSPNIYRTPSESLQSFKYFSEVGQWDKVFTTFERQFVTYVGAAAMYFVGKMLKKRYNLNDDVRMSLYNAGNDWVRAIGNDRTFMGGKQPNLADLAVYGALSAIEGCEAFEDMLNNTQISKWYFATKTAVEHSTGVRNLNMKYEINQAMLYS